MMDIITKVCDDTGNICFQGTTRIIPENLIYVAQNKVAYAREKGDDFMKSAIPEYGKRLIEVVQNGIIGDPVDSAAMHVALVTWLWEHLFNGLAEEEFIESSLEYVMFPSGVVQYTRHF